jgi:sugar (pentulose or hexulose) kinase
VALEGIALKYRWVLERLEELSGKRLDPIHIIGGGTKNRLWTQIVLDVLGVDGTIPDHGGSSLGAAMLAGVGNGVFRDLQEAVEKCRGNEVSIAHSPDNHDRYVRLFKRYRRIKGSFDPIYEID